MRVKKAEKLPRGARAVAVSTRPLVTVRCQEDFELVTNGALVRYIPQWGASTSAIEAAVLQLRIAGAHAVKVLPAEDPSKPVLSVEEETVPRGTVGGIRQVVMEVSLRMKNVDADALQARLREILDEVGA